MNDHFSAREKRTLSLQMTFDRWIWLRDIAPLTPLKIQTACLYGNFAIQTVKIPETRVAWKNRRRFFKEMGYDFILEENSCSTFGVRFLCQIFGWEENMVVLRRMTVIGKLSKIGFFLPRAFANHVCVCLGHLWRPHRPRSPQNGGF